MTKESKTEEAVQEAVEAANEALETAQEAVETLAAAAGAKPKKKKKWPIVLAIILGVLVLAGVGGWVWHEQPSFCAAICHSPMDPYLETYDQAAGVAGIDKYGREVSNTDSMLAVTHAAAGVTCLDCHTANLDQQIEEGKTWLAGDFQDPLKERRLKDLVLATGIEADDFCLREGCHEVTNRDELFAIYADEEINVHNPIHSYQPCSNCHKAHRASVVLCSQCHGEHMDIPDGWLTVQEEAAMKAAA